MKKSWPIYSIVSALFISISAILSKKSLTLDLNKTDTLLQATIFTSIMSITLLFILILSGKIKLLKSIDKYILLKVTPSGIFAGLGWLTYLFALKYAPACQLSTLAAIDKSSICFIAILAIIFLRDKINFYSVTGLIFFISGILLMLIK